MSTFRRVSGRALVVSADERSIARAGQVLAKGELVAFPTETVYGLGCDATNERAIEAVFEAKRRPRTDPLIVHVADLQQALTLAELTSEERALVRDLAARFWPGPLTLVVRAASHLPRALMAGGAFVGLRVPAHEVARALIVAARTPVAAPSANRFGHVSPTTAAHVLDDLGDVSLTILDGGACGGGIESTVVKVDGDALATLRRGPILERELLAAVGRAAPLRMRDVERTQGHESPGQSLRHYALDRPTFLLANDGDIEATLDPSSIALVDFGGRAKRFAEAAHIAIDLSPRGDAREAGAALYAILRALEARDDVHAIVLPDLRDEHDEALLALADRLARAASGRRASLVVPRSITLKSISKADRS